MIRGLAGLERLRIVFAFAIGLPWFMLWVPPAAA
jgi:hypothetical protein